MIGRYHAKYFARHFHSWNSLHSGSKIEPFAVSILAVTLALVLAKKNQNLY